MRKNGRKDGGKEDGSMSKENGYVGKIKSGGTQHVEAPHQVRSSAKGYQKITGNDLRNKNGGKAGK